jgi:hypothetical protein
MAAAEDPPPSYDAGGYSARDPSLAPYHVVRNTATLYILGLKDFHYWDVPPYTTEQAGEYDDIIYGAGWFYARGICGGAPNSAYKDFKGYIPLLKKDLRTLVYLWLRGQYDGGLVVDGFRYSCYELSLRISEQVSTLLEQIHLHHTLGISFPIACPIVNTHDIDGLAPGVRPKFAYIERILMYVSGMGARMTVFADDDPRKHLFGYAHPDIVQSLF